MNYNYTQLDNNNTSFTYKIVWNAASRRTNTIPSIQLWIKAVSLALFNHAHNIDKLLSIMDEDQAASLVRDIANYSSLLKERVVSDHYVDMIISFVDKIKDGVMSYQGLVKCIDTSLYVSIDEVHKQVREYLEQKGRQIYFDGTTLHDGYKEISFDEYISIFMDATKDAEVMKKVLNVTISGLCKWGPMSDPKFINPSLESKWLQILAAFVDMDYEREIYQAVCVDDKIKPDISYVCELIETSYDNDTKELVNIAKEFEEQRTHIMSFRGIDYALRELLKDIYSELDKDYEVLTIGGGFYMAQNTFGDLQSVIRELNTDRTYRRVLVISSWNIPNQSIMSLLLHALNKALRVVMVTNILREFLPPLLVTSYFQPYPCYGIIVAEFNYIYEPKYNYLTSPDIHEEFFNVDDRTDVAMIVCQNGRRQLRSIIRDDDEKSFFMPLQSRGVIWKKRLKWRFNMYTSSHGIARPPESYNIKSQDFKRKYDLISSSLDDKGGSSS